ncbi:unnamed protein product [Microthlaspi erraticum]|uniref:TF-B3 domain-containing protein n=1 Tax=Microthlaspi erraticum TaxID=1685480 RepID=A0A6D2IFP4_9BRAS|nr:unnamed protein product [Microthlaspi erraticum]
MAISKKRTMTRRLTLEEEKEREDQDDIVRAAFAISHMMFIRDITEADANTQALSARKRRKIVEEDNSEETLDLLLRWINGTKIRPEEIVGRCSKPIRKQLTESDVKEDQNRLMLGKLQVEKTMVPLLKESEIPRGTNGLEVMVYGPDGKVHEMMFKLWNKKTPVLTCGWNKFVATYGLKMHCDFLTISMFRHVVTREICFAINSTRLPVKRQLSRRISKIAFKL